MADNMEWWAATDSGLWKQPSMEIDHGGMDNHQMLVDLPPRSANLFGTPAEQRLEQPRIIFVLFGVLSFGWLSFPKESGDIMTQQPRTWLILAACELSYARHHD